MKALGIKLKPKARNELDEFEETGLQTFAFTKKEKEAWIKANMPEPVSFLKEYRLKHGY